MKKSCQNKLSFKTIIPDVPVGIYIKDLDNKIIATNQEFANIAGLRKKDLLNKKLEDIFSHEDWSSAKLRDNEVIKTKRYIRIKRSVIDNTNNVRHFRILKSPIINKKGEVEGFLVFFNNIDIEQKHEESKNAFIATLMHDLKTPTTAQLNIIKLLLNGEFGSLNEKQQEMLSLTKCSAEYLFNLVATIVDSYKCDCDKLKLNCHNFDILILIKALCKGIETLAQEKGQKININQNTEECFIFADRLQIKRVIVNFLANAINYGFNNTNINVNLFTTEDTIDFSVTNKSKQINNEQLKNIFSKFTNTEMSLNNKASTGLGLYLSKQIITLHHGEIYAQSFEDGTCVFGFKLNTNNPLLLKENEIAFL